MQAPLKIFFASLAPYFFSEAGHYRAYHTELLAAMRSLGAEAFALIPHSCEAKNLGPWWIRFFHHANNRIVRTFLRLKDYVRVVRLVGEKPHSRKVVFLESYSLLDLVSLLVATLLFARKKIELWHMFRDGLEWNLFKRRLHLAIAKAFRWKLGNNYKAFTDSRKIIESLTPDLQMPITLLPIPHIETVVKKERVDEMIRLWLPGKPRADKGTGEIALFCHKVDPYLKNMELRLEPLDELKGCKNLTLRWMASSLSREEYLKNLAEVDILLLPYDPVLYVSRTSGPFVEGICAGKMVFTKEGNWLAYELRQHDLSECILDWDAPDAPTVLAQVFRNSESWAKLEKMRVSYHRFHNPTFFKKSLEGAIN